MAETESHSPTPIEIIREIGARGVEWPTRTAIHCPGHQRTWFQLPGRPPRQIGAALVDLDVAGSAMDW
jgi:hypothetical protein